MYPSLLKIGEKHLYPAKSFSQLTGCLSIKKCINAMTFKFINNVCPYSLIEIYEYSPQCRIESRSNFVNLDVPFPKTSMCQEDLSFIGPSLWKSLSSRIYEINTVFNIFKHNLKNQYVGNLAES